MARISRWTTIAAAVLLGLAPFATVQAQPPEGGRGRGPQGDHGGMMRGGGGVLGLLRLEAVQKELNLSAEQLEQLEALGADSRGPEAQPREAQPRGRRGRSQGDRGSQRRTTRGDQRGPNGQIESLLETEQLERLRQIGLQMRLKMQGADAFSDRRIAKELDITSEQKKQFYQLRKEMRESFRKERPQRGAKRSRDLSQEQRMAKMTEMREKFETLRKESLKKALAVLTTEQKEKLEQLTGEEVEIDMRDLRPPRRGGPGEGGPGGEGRPRGPRPGQQ